MATLRLGSRVFAPRLVPTLAVLAGVALLASLGTWQLHRAADKRALVAAFAAGTAAPIALPGALETRPRYARVEARGHFLPERQFLLDNMTHAGSAGYHVLTPFVTDAGPVVLVDRGWIPLGASRATLPDVRVADAERVVVGRLDDLPRAGIRLEAPAETGWPRRMSYPTHEALAAALALPLYPGMLLLDADAPDGYARDWQPPSPTPERHLGYALQWYALALTLLVLYCFATLKTPEIRR